MNLRSRLPYALFVLAPLAGSCQSNAGQPRPGNTASGGNAGQGTGGSSGGVSAGGSVTGGGTAGVPGAGGASSATVGLAVGPFTTCIVDAQKAVKCLGRCGASGAGGSRDKAPDGLMASAVAVGRSFACSLSQPGPGAGVKCWGEGAVISPPAIADAVELVAGDGHACVRSSGGAVTCWGDAPHMAPDALVAKALAGSGAMSCAITSDDSVRCWGLRHAEPPADLRAQKIAVSSQLTDPKNGPRFGCAVTIAGDVRCWGDDPGGVQSVPPGLKAKAIATGRSHACAIGADDVVSCWGTPPRFGAPLPAGMKASALSMSFRSAGAIKPDGSFAFWGDISDGRSTF